MEEFDWLSSNTKTAYPFATRQADDTHKLFVDAAVFHANLRDKKEAIRISHVVLTPGSESVQLNFSDGALLLLLDTLNSDFQRTVFGAYTVFEWAHSTINSIIAATVFNPPGEGFSFEDQNVKLVVFTEALTDFSDDLTLADGYLVPSLVNPMAKGVRKLIVRLPDLVTPSLVRYFEILNSKVKFRAGLNTRLSVVPQTSIEARVPRAKRTILVDVEPGAGQGYFVNCDPSQHPGIRTINHVPPNPLGNVTLSGQDCVWVETLMDNVISESSNFEYTDYVGSMQAGALALHNDCGACCDCEDYQQAYEAIRSTWDKAKNVASSVESLRQDYNILVPIVADIAQGPAVKGDCGQITTQVSPTANYQLSITARLENTTDNWLANNVFEIDLLNMPGFKPIAGSGQWLISDQAGAPISLDPVSTDIYESPTQAHSLMQVALPWAKPKTSYSYRFSGRFDAVPGFSRQNSATAVLFKFKNNGGYIVDPNDPDSAHDATPCLIKVQTPFTLVGPSTMS